MAGTLTISTLSDGTNSTSATNPIKGSARAWVNFNGTGTVAIRSSYNVSSITDNGTGDYTVNFTNALPDANYCANVTSGGFSITERTIVGTAYALTTSSVKANTAICTNGALYDPNLISVSIFSS
jgi:hypothetical protein